MQRAMRTMRFTQMTRAFLVFVFAAVALNLVLARPAWAYVDPSVMTYTIQALAGVAVALGAVAGVAWRRVRASLYRALEIDPDRKKTMEADVSRVEPDRAPRRPTQAACPRKPQRARLLLPWPKRLVSTLLASLFAVFTLLVFPAFEIVAGSASDISFSVLDVAPVYLLAALAVSAVLGFVLSIPKRAHGVIVGLLVAVGFCAFLQASVLNYSLPIADGSSVDWNAYRGISAVSVVVWALVIILFLALAVRRERLMRLFGFVVGILLVCTQAVSLGMAVPESLEQQEVQVTQEGLFTVSSKSNVVVIILDCYDNSLTKEALAADPSLNEALAGLTYYSNATGSFERTRYALPYLLTGDMSQEAGATSRWTNATQLLGGVADRGYSVGLYSMNLYDGRDALKDLSLNIHRFDVQINEDSVVPTLATCALYRCLPWPCKPSFQFYTNDLNVEIVDVSSDDDSSVAYIYDDAAYYNRLCTDGLSATDDSETGAFRFIHLNGAHDPYVLTADVEEDAATATQVSQAVASLKIVGEYISELKRLGVYDRTCLVVTADHGTFTDESASLEEVVNPVLMVKPAGEGASSALTLAESTVATGHLDYPATIEDATGGDASAWSGTPIYRVTANNRVRYFTHVWNINSNGGAENDFKWIEYAIRGDANDLANWSKTGRTWDPILPD